MRIRYTEFALNPALRGTITHLPQHRAQALIDSGAAVELPYKNYVERLNDEQAQRAADPKNAPATGWSVRESVGNNPRVRFVVVETSPLGEITFYDAPRRMLRRPLSKSTPMLLRQMQQPSAAAQSFSQSKPESRVSRRGTLRPISLP
jgi:hypothetical protein